MILILWLYIVGKPVYGESGELVCTKPFPSMPTHFWHDEGGKKYHKAYFDKFPGKLTTFMVKVTYTYIWYQVPSIP